MNIENLTSKRCIIKVLGWKMLLDTVRAPRGRVAFRFINRTRRRIP